MFRLTLRAFVALVLLATALGKLLDVAGFVRVLETYAAIAPGLLWPIAFATVVEEGVMIALSLWLAAAVQEARASDARAGGSSRTASV